MFFKGTSAVRPLARSGWKSTRWRRVQRLPEQEYTGYYIKCAADYRDRTLDVLVDISATRFEREISARR
jgi:hypothetical protein